MASISILIRTFNEEKHLPALLSALKEQDYQDFEVIVVDSGSLDNTRAIAEKNADKLIRIDSRDFTFGYSLNSGVKAASGKIVVIVSAHTLPVEKNWLSSLLKHFDNPKTAMVYGRQMGELKSKYSECRDFDRIFGKKSLILEPPNFFANNANAAIRRDLWLEHKFDEGLPGLEDIEWAKFWMQKGYSVIYEPQAAIFHIHEESWRQIRRRYSREAVAAHSIGIKSRFNAVSDSFWEVTYLFSDYLSLLASGFTSGLGSSKRSFVKDFNEIFGFRLNKAVGNARGLFDSATFKTVESRKSAFFDRSTHAAVIEGPSEVSIKELDIPNLKPGEVLIRTAFTAVCGTDLEIYDGTLGYYQSGMAKYPIVPGHEFSGHIIEYGANVSGLKEGDPVVVECIQSCGTCEDCRNANWIGCSDRAEVGVLGLNGAYSEYVVVPSRFVHVLPQGSDMRRAALCEPIAVALKGISRLGLDKVAEKKQCAVVGAGSLGHICAKILQSYGHNVTAFDKEPRRLEYFSGTSIKTLSDLCRLNDFQYLIEVTGDPHALDEILVRSRAGATILLLGLPYAKKEFNFESIVAFDKTIVGSVGSSAEDFRKAIKILSSLDLDVLTKFSVPFERFEEGWQKFRNREALKLLLSFSSEGSGDERS